MSATKHRKTTSSSHLKPLLPSISRKESAISIVDQKHRLSHRTSKSQNIAPAIDKIMPASFLVPVASGLVDLSGEIGAKLEGALKMVDLALEYHQKKQFESVLIIMDEIENSCLAYQIKPLVFGFYTVYCTVLLELGEYPKCLIAGKQLLSEGMYNADHAAMLCAYEKIGEANSKMKNFEQALRNYFMMLKVALYIKDYKKELVAYDKIGFQYFNLNQLDRGEYFHTKMLEDRIEPDNSNLRKLLVIESGSDMKVGMRSNKQLDADAQDLEDLAMVFFEPMAVNPKYRELDSKRMKAFEYQDSQKNPARRIGNVKVFGQSPDHIKIARAGYTLKPTNAPIATLAHLSANRSIKVFDAISGSGSKGYFRFLKFGKQLNAYNRKAVWDALTDLKLLIVDCQKKMMPYTDNQSGLVN